MQKTAKKSCILLFLPSRTIITGLCTMRYVFPLNESVKKICILGKQKCLSKTGDCLVKHGVVHATGLQLVVR